MMKLDPIIAVKDLQKSSKWYEQIFDFKNLHGSDHFGILSTAENEIVLCLHPWEQDEHPSMMNREITPGNGLILYFKTDKMEEIRDKAVAIGAKIDQDIHVNPNPNKREFSMWDPDGYYIIITEYHEYEG